MYTDIDLRIKDTAIQSFKDPVVFVKKGSSDPKYRVKIYLSGRSLPFIESVKYHLHHTFSNPDVKVKRSISNPDCSFTIWTWGLFEVKAEVKMQDGNVIRLKHFLNYDKEIKSTPASRFVYQ